MSLEGMPLPLEPVRQSLEDGVTRNPVQSGAAVR